MGVLSNADLRALRGVQADNFPHRCSLEYPVYTDRPTGGRTLSGWTTYASDVPCRLTPLSGEELPRGLALTPETNYRLTLPYGQRAETTHRATVAGETDDVPWVVRIGLTYVETPKAFTSSTPAYGTDKVAQAIADAL